MNRENWDERESQHFSVHSAQIGAQYNPFREEDQVELIELRNSRFHASRLTRPHTVRYNRTTQDDPDDIDSIERREIEEFVERDQRAAGKCRQFCSFSLLIVAAQVYRMSPFRRC